MLLELSSEEGESTSSMARFSSSRAALILALVSSLA